MVSTNPDQGATNVPINRIISASFNTRMNPATINQVSFTLHGPTQGGRSGDPTPTYRLLHSRKQSGPNTDYTRRISTSVKEVRGECLASRLRLDVSHQCYSSPAACQSEYGCPVPNHSRRGISNNAGFSEIHDMDIGISPGVRSSITGSLRALS
ncbi:MAG: Ig-like domain-containing protein [Saprospirales bacterium]|nr:Ig-like domain-containing protein [Saprospirales bacterium]